MTSRPIALFSALVFATSLVPPVGAQNPAPVTRTKAEAFAGDFSGDVKVPGGDWVLWYPRPAGEWTSALPVGNGRIGAMVFGGVTSERIQVNEHTIWNGKPHSYARKGAVEHLPELRRLLQDGRKMDREAQAKDAAGAKDEANALRKQASENQKAAHALGMKGFMSDPLGQAAYQPGVDLWLDFPAQAQVSNFRRWLDLDAALATTEYTAGGATIRREVFASHPDNVLVTRISSDKPGAIECAIGLGTLHKNPVLSVDGKRLRLDAQVSQDGVRFSCQLAVEAIGGTVEPSANGLHVRGADAVVVRLALGTSFVDFRDISADPAARAKRDLDQAVAKSGKALLEAHQADHRAMFRRVALDLGRTPAADLPTGERIEKFKDGGDPQLASLAFQYGRYLLIASSRPGGQPANLQGIWNDLTNPPWGSKYTCNINTQMNYWPALVANLAECQQPLFDAMPELMASGKETAREHYGLDGWVLHHNFDLWRGTAPINGADHGIWVTGGAWLCHHLWEHYLVTGDRGFLAKRAYPIMKEACRFFTGYLIEDPLTGWLISGPSNSPEQGGLVMGPSMDHQIIRSLLRATAQASAILQVDADLAKQWVEMAGKIAPNQVGKHGQLQEWTEDKDDPKNQHRHVSHLWGAYPGCDITWRDSKFFDAARQSLVYRGDAATGWSMGWKINLWARFLDGDHAYVIIGNLLKPSVGKDTMISGGGMYPNLFDAHPPFQIDGNFGYTAGVAEMLLQSHVAVADVQRASPAQAPEFLVHLLPALPKAWPDGQVRGLVARGGFTVDIAWKSGQLTKAEIHPARGGVLHLKLGDKQKRLETRAGATIVVGPSLDVR